MKKYILKDKVPVECPDLMTWANWFETESRRVAKTTIETPNGKIEISTVFLGLDHSFLSDTPVLFETMIFGGPSDQECVRYRTWSEAYTGHMDTVDELLGIEGARPVLVE